MTSHDTDRLGTRDLAPSAHPADGAALGEQREHGRSAAEPSDTTAVPSDTTAEPSGTTAVRADDMSGSSTRSDGQVGNGASETPAREGDGADPVADPTPASEDEPLLDADVSARLRRHWEGVQTRFVDAPRDAVEEADELVASVMRLLADGFAEERERLEAQWGNGGDVSTEDLRVALQRYRSFFHRLLTT